MNKKAILGNIFAFFFGVLVYFTALAAFSPMLDNVSESTIDSIDTAERPFLTLILYMFKPLVWLISLLGVVLLYIIMFSGGGASA